MILKRFYSLIFTVILSLLFVSAQDFKRVSNYIFEPEWYLGIYAGPNLVVAEGFPYASLFDAMGVQVNPIVGYQFSPELSVRAGASFGFYNWPDTRPNPDSIQSMKAQSAYVDFVFNLSNLFFDYDLYRTLDVSIFAGLGAIHRNSFFPTNDFYGLSFRAGGQFDIHLTQFWDLNLAANLNVTNDNFNNVGGGTSIEILPAALIGLTYHFRTNRPFKRGCCD